MKRIIAFTFAILLVMASLLVVASAEDETIADTEVVTEAVTVTDEQYDKAVAVIKDKYPDQFDIVEAYYQSMVAKIEATGKMEGLSNFLYKHSDQICAILVGLGVLAISLYIVIDRYFLKGSVKESSNTAKVAANNAVTVYNEASLKVAESENSIKLLSEKCENNMGDMLTVAKGFVETAVKDVEKKMDENDANLQQVAKSVLVLSYILASMVDEMDIKPTVKNNIHAAINKANKEVTDLEKSVEEADS